MAHVIVGVTGSVATIRITKLVTGLQQAGHAVQVVATEPATHFFAPASLPVPVWRDADEWPNRQRPDPPAYHRGDPILHIELRRWGQLLLIAPLDANTLAKLAVGLADNLLSCLWRAWEPSRPVLLAPAMNTQMWQHPSTARHLRMLWQDWAAAGSVEPDRQGADDWAAAINRDCPRLRIIGPICKRLACGQEGPGAMAEVADLLAQVQSALSVSGGESGP